MRQALLIAVAAAYISTALAQTATSPRPMPTPEIDYYAASPPHPTHDEFFSHITYPYRASAERQSRIEHAARVIRIGCTEPQLLQLLGQPDYKIPTYHFIYPPQRFVADEAWLYVHTIEQPSRVQWAGKALRVLLSNRSKPRKVIVVDKIGFWRGHHRRGSNQALERTATRFVFTFWVAKTSWLRTTDAPGGRRSAPSR